MKTLPVFLLLVLAAVSLSAQPPVSKERPTDTVRGPVRAEPEAPSKAEPGPRSFGAEAATVRLIRFSGALRPEASGLGQPRTGTVGVTFALYKEQSGGAPLWLETQNVELGADGRYTVLLGTSHNEGLPLEIFASEEARWLAIQVQGEEEQARVLLVSVPYALKAADAERLGGKPAEAFLLAAPSGEESEKSGSGQGKTLSKGGNGTLAQVVSGTVDRIAKFTAADAVGDSDMLQTGGGDFGVGTTTPLGKLHVQKTGALTKLVVGNPNPVANNASDGFIQIFGENAGVVKSVFIQNIGDSLQLNGAGTGVNIQLLGAFETSILNGTSLGVYDTANAKRLYIRHDGTRVLFSTSGTNAGGMAFRPVANLTNAFQFQVAGGATTVMNIDTTNQRVGIGTTSPQGKLHVVGVSGGLVIQDTATSPNLIGGFSGNSVSGGVVGATIGGGGETASTNEVTVNFGTVGGGEANTASGLHATVGGGSGNSANSEKATVSGGSGNSAVAFGSTVAGGNNNVAGGNSAFIGAGVSNAATGERAVVPGGVLNAASGITSFAAGRRARALNDGAFVWGDSTDADMASSADNQFIARAAGHFFFQSDSTLDDQGGFINTSTGGFLSTGGTWTNASDGNAKANFVEVDAGEVLARLAAVPIRRWNYKVEDAGVRHLGPTAQDFYIAFGLGTDDKHIATIDADGVALAAIQALYRLAQEEEEQLRQQARELDRLRAELASLRAELEEAKRVLAQVANQLPAQRAQQ